MTMATPTNQQRQFPCKQCGANVQYAPGTKTLACPYCGTTNEIPESGTVVEELDYQAWLTKVADEHPTDEVLTVKCEKCAAEATLPPNVTADLCPFCGSPIVAEAVSKRRIKPQGLLPFHVTRDQAMAAFRAWVRGLWFAPGSLRSNADAEAGIKGIYIPCWTYDADTQSDYTGQRGDDYWETETYTTVENGKTVTRTRQVRKTRWHYVSGMVDNRFNDLLVLATTSLPRKYAEALEPWDLGSVIAYSDEYLSGFVAQSYQVDLPGGFEMARQMMVEPIEQTIRQDIGGDHQSIDSVRTRYYNITFKHLLLPVWMSAYRYNGRTFRFLVNARTGEVQGERPYSAGKIILLVVLILAVVSAALVILNATGALHHVQNLQLPTNMNRW
jgi:DNA-directed RNA polymerase subunit RPC12/RpoP